ncbi:DUF6794 domain-containing protein [Dysgonomonas sp. 25]|uniref:DUF6794 domain-containing protein n=1 Tax=Dysgonomonas sp. 25 TaxID=2302933 RepID=UPI0013D3F1A2|nr:DUF6794 domain-containing protein [Dysgonomonas sp. 25]NDV69435.1 hypothetical protein [Dysgonomonas sp. 25]
MTRLLLFILSFGCFIFSYAQEEIDYSKLDSIDGVYIPVDLDDCVRQLDIILSDSVKTEIAEMNRSSFLGLSHRGLGMWIRNNWGLWRRSRLSNYFHKRIDEKYGEGEMSLARHPDSMSAGILSYYYHYLINKDIDWDTIKSDCKSSSCPSNDTEIQFDSATIYIDKQGNRKKAHFSYISDDEAWIYCEEMRWNKIKREDMGSIEYAKEDSRYEKIKESIEKNKKL